MPTNTAFIQTVKERCRVCYTCVRECPAKAIRIVNAQAEVMSDRCICCGNCVRVCSQKAKQVVSSREPVEAMLTTGASVAACLAPSFPAEFCDVPTDRLVGLVRKLGFSLVCEVAFGADLVADRYRRLLAHASPNDRYIASTCPALVEFVERYFPEWIGHLAPIVSPMVAMARALRRIHGPDLKVVFIGPCVAKKHESASHTLAGDVDAALTFGELRAMFADHALDAASAPTSDFDPPRAALGGLFSISRGLLQSAGISEDLVTGDVVAAEGRSRFVEAIDEFAAGSLNARLLEVLCCNGCIMGSGMTSTEPMFERRARVSRYIGRRMHDLDRARWQRDMEALADMDLSRGYAANDQRIDMPSPRDLADIMARLGKLKPDDELNCGACGYDTCREHASAIHMKLAESEMCLPYTIDQLRRTVKELAISNEQLANTQEALMQSEKLASMGQLAAGIAHEVNNPLGVVLMYAHLMLDECSREPRLRDDLSMIVEQADRCKKIVSNLLHFARQNKVLLLETDVRELAEKACRGLPAPGNVRVRTDFRCVDPLAELDRDQIIQVLTNLLSNAYAAMPGGGEVTVSCWDAGEQVHLSVADTGVGIPPENLTKIFEPFFTTKQIGKGTGLGLAVTYGIVKMHRGDIRVCSNANPAAGPTGTTFTVTLPRRARPD